MGLFPDIFDASAPMVEGAWIDVLKVDTQRTDQDTPQPVQKSLPARDSKGRFIKREE